MRAIPSSPVTQTNRAAPIGTALSVSPHMRRTLNRLLPVLAIVDQAVDDAGIGQGGGVAHEALFLLSISVVAWKVMFKKRQPHKVSDAGYSVLTGQDGGDDQQIRSPKNKAIKPFFGAFAGQTAWAWIGAIRQSVKISATSPFSTSSSARNLGTLPTPAPARISR